MNMLTFTLAFAALWVAQMLLSWRQAKRFMADVAVLRRSGVVSIGRGKRRGLRTYVALAVADGVVTDTRILNGYTVFARAKRQEGLVGTRVEELHGGALDLKNVPALQQVWLDIPSHYGRIWTLS